MWSGPVSGLRDDAQRAVLCRGPRDREQARSDRSEEHTSELQSPCNLVCRLLLEKKKKYYIRHIRGYNLYTYCFYFDTLLLSRLNSVDRVNFTLNGVIYLLCRVAIDSMRVSALC